MRKLLSLILAAVLVMSSVPYVTVLAAEADKRDIVYFEPEYFDSPEAIYNSIQLLEQSVDMQALRAALYEAVSQCADELDITSFAVPYSLRIELMEYIYYAMPEAFHVGSVGYYNYGHNEIIQYICFGYRYFCNTPELFEQHNALFTAAADKILEGIEGNDSLSDEKKALLIHDRLALWTEYDFNEANVNKYPYTAYGALVKRSAVCQGYAMAYLYLLERAGIEAYYCASSQLNHAWNIVYIDGVPYHVDVTWDDRRWDNTPGHGFTGRVDHDNFLRSTEGIKATGHNATDFNSAPQNTKYDSYFWQNSTTAFELIYDEIYYIDNSAETINRYSDKRTLISISDDWYSTNGGVWSADFSCLSSAGGDLFYSKTDGVYKYTPSTDTAKKIYSPSLTGVEAVYGFTYEDGYLICDINNTPNDAVNLTRIKEPYSDITLILEGIEIKALPEKTVYYLGDTFDSTGIQVNGIYSGHTRKPIASGLTFSGFSSFTAGEKTVRVNYEGKTADFKVTVKTPVIEIVGDSLTFTQKNSTPVAVTHEPSGMNVTLSLSPSEGVSVNGLNITVNNTGNYTLTATGTYNGREFTDICPVTVVCRHDNSEAVGGVSPSCKYPGYTSGVYCYDCETYISGHREIEPVATAHQFDNGRIIKPGTCVSRAEILFTCIYDDTHTEIQYRSTDVFNHVNVVPTPATEPTCSLEGFTAGEQCTDCGRYLSGHEEIPIVPDAHKWNDGDVIIEGSCQGDGTKYFVCEYNPLHHYNEDLPENPNRHLDTTAVPEKPATCLEDGYTAGIYCNGCETFVTGHIEIPASEEHHKWDSGYVTKEAGCNSGGERRFTCEYDYTHTYTAYIPLDPDNHINSVYVPGMPPTCSDPGYTEGYFCNDCYRYVSGGNAIPVSPVSHKWGEGRKATASTCSVPGKMVYVCEYNHEHIRSYDLLLDPDIHINITLAQEIPPTAYEVGYTAGVYCNDCKRFVVGHEEIPKTAPTIVESDKVKLEGDRLILASGITLSELFPTNYNDAEIWGPKANKLSGDDIFTTETTIVFPDKVLRVVVAGDVDCDGAVTASDARLALRASVGLESYEEGSLIYRAANVMTTDNLSASDARAILRASVGLEKIIL